MGGDKNVLKSVHKFNTIENTKYILCFKTCTGFAHVYNPNLHLNINKS